MRLTVGGVVLVAVLLLSGGATAQTQACVPACRTGFVCVEGSCMSACNPPCASDERCTAEGDCELRRPPKRRRSHARSSESEPELESEPEASETPSSDSDAGIRTHDGVYVRLALGLGYMASKRTFYELALVDSSGVPPQAPRFEQIEVIHGINGFAQVGALMVGGTPAAGLVVGGGAWGVNVIAPQVSVDVITETGTIRQTVDTELLSISMIGPFVAWYPNPRGGWHGELGFGYAYVASGKGKTAPLSDWDSSGWGAIGAVGHDFWIGQQWSAGVLARASFVQAKNDLDTFIGVVPALLATATFH